MSPRHTSIHCQWRTVSPGRSFVIRSLPSLSFPAAASLVPRPDSTPPTLDSTRAYWYPRVRGALTVIGGTLAYVALASAFGNDASFGTAFVGMIGSTAAMGWVWWLEARRAARHESAQRASAQRDAGTT